jgi:hypothetical protein
MSRTRSGAVQDSHEHGGTAANPNCGGGELEIIAAILERPVIEKILSHLGLDPQPPPKARAREAGQD